MFHNANMTSNEIRAKFLDFFKANGHTVVPSSSLIPDDPTVLLTTAGMQQFKPYYTELDPTVTAHPSLGRPIGRNACSVQKCFRTTDIDVVGDATHLTMFEMLGNFSFGGYYKKEAIHYAYEFITKVMGLPISYVSIFKGSDIIPEDIESKKIWQSLGVTDIRNEGMEDVFWGPTGSGGPCGPTTEIYCKTSEGKDVEVWNIVFNEFVCSGTREDLMSGNAKLEKVTTPGVDTGMGFERLVTIVQKTKSIYDTDVFQVVFGDILKNENVKSARIVADHLRSVVFLLADGITPSNKDRGYVLRRIIRRLVVHSQKIGLVKSDLLVKIDALAALYGGTYPEITNSLAAIKDGLSKEYDKFSKTLAEGLALYNKLYSSAKNDTSTFVEKMSKNAFDLYQSHGLPLDVTFDLLDEGDLSFDRNVLRQKAADLFSWHQKVSGSGAAEKFGGHGLGVETKNISEKDAKRITQLHTATHLLHQALRQTLGEQVHQQGSDITPERLRFDFTFPQKLAPEQISAVERIVNNAIEKDLLVGVAEMPYAQAVSEGALAFFKDKYPETVKVYSIGDFSKEVCGGPHVTHTKEIGRFKIVKEEAVSAGVRRIRATVE
jgi:alanyl-tRNA synthetase